MSKKIECRLPDDLYADLKEYASKEGVTVTDIVIAGINSQIHSLVGETVYESEPVRKVKKRPIDVAPLVKSLLAGVKVNPTVQHHPQCRCGVCKVD